MPTGAYAITGHDSMPEYRSFEPVSTTNMVNIFNGGFTYNIPLLNVPNGYPINLSYHSGEVNNEALSSWVGLGWNINPGTINRIKRGVPDEFNKVPVKYHNRMPSNWTISAGLTARPELFGDESLINLDLGANVRYNNYKGLGTSISAGIDFGGVANLTLERSNGRFGFNPEINPFQLLYTDLKKMKRTGSNKEYTSSKVDAIEMKQAIEDKMKGGMSREDAVFSEIAAKHEKNLDRAPGGGGKQISFGGQNAREYVKEAGTMFSSLLSQQRSYPTAVTAYKGFMASLQFDLGINFISLPIDAELSGTGSFNSQTNIPETSIDAYGYMFNENALNDVDATMDYMTESERMFQKRDNLLGYPLPNSDMFSQSGEAMGGSFKTYRSEYGHYRKNKVYSEDISISLGADVNIPSMIGVVPPFYFLNTEWGAGGEIGANYHFTNIGDMGGFAANTSNGFTGSSAYPKSDEKFFFWFSGDKAGFWDEQASYNGANQVTFRDNLPNTKFKTDLSNSTPFEPSIVIDPSITHSVKDFRAEDNRKNKRRSTYIQMHTNSDFDKESENSNGATTNYDVWQKNDHFLTLSAANTKVYSSSNKVDRDGGMDEGVGEFVTYNGDGVAYVYGLPVKVRNEKEINYSFPNGSGLNMPTGTWDADKEAQLLMPTVKSTFTDANARRKLGRETDQAYSNSHLLTQILSPDYIDRTGDGPTQDDFGSFTKFNYVRVAGGSNWYNYRTPYDGVNFNQGSLSDRQDDMGSFSYGEKEIYYLESVVSKTHVAIFTLESREDGLSAPLADNASTENIAKGSDGSAKMQLKRLKRIDLYAINDATVESHVSGTDVGMWKAKSTANPIKTVHFSYDYSLAQGVPNNDSGITGDEGKLTLKKVWFEYGGKIRSKISPYTFDYEYPSTQSGANSEYPANYHTEFGNYGVNVSSYENPDYSPVNSDRWGSYRDFGSLYSHIGKLARFWPFVDQNIKDLATRTYDEAAYALKKIGLPSGGEIHVQYEQSDYQYVQDKRAMMMVPLLAGSGKTSQDEQIKNKKYYLDMDVVDINFPAGGTTAEKDAFVHDLFQPMSNKKEGGGEPDRMYFNFLYALLGTTVDAESTSSDYLEGYASISSYGYDANGVYFKFKGSGLHDVTRSTPTSKYEIPREVCVDFYKNNRQLKIDGGANATALEDASEGGEDEELVSAFMNIVDRIGQGLKEKCRRMDPAMSYVRVQVPINKKKLGGGFRVKRLMMYTQGLGGGPNHLYGNEYQYTTVEKGSVISSGVATNEPGIGRRESPLVNPIERDAQSKAHAFFFGRDMYGQEGPLGESLLPSASIGYSKVTVLPIHKGTTNTGYETHEFYTCKDFPFKATKSTVRKHLDIPTVVIPVKIKGFSASYSRNTPSFAQSFLFQTYDMHGKQRKISKYSKSTNAPIAYELYDYFGINDDVHVMGKDMKLRTVKMQEMGREAEMLSEVREVQDYSFGGNIGKDWAGGGAHFFIPPFIPYLYVPVPVTTKVTGGVNVSEQIIRTHVTSKIVNYPSLLKKVTNYADGVSQVVEHVVFDDNTGNPVVTKSYDDFGGTYVSQDIQAAWMYDNMGAKFLNEGRTLTFAANTASMTNSGSAILLSGSGGGGCSAAVNALVPGDFVKLNGGDNYLYHVDNITPATDGVLIGLQKSQFGHNTTIVDGVDITSLEIIRSGRTNMLNTKMGSVKFFDQSTLTTSAQAVAKIIQDNDLGEKYGSHAFTTQLQSQLVALNVQDGGGEVNPSLPGPYIMDVSAFASWLPASCVTADIQAVSVSNVIASVIVTNGEMELVIKGFDVSCGGSSYTLDCSNPVTTCNTIDLAYSQCGDRDATFDLTSQIPSMYPTANGNESYIWCSDAAGNNPLNVNDESAYVSGTKVVYLKVIDGNCESIASLTLQVTDLGLTNEIVSSCWSSIGQIKDLTTSSVQNGIYSGGYSDQTVTYEYYYDSKLTNEIANPSQFQISSHFSSGWVYVKVTKGNCTATARIRITNCAA